MVTSHPKMEGRFSEGGGFETVSGTFSFVDMKFLINSIPRGVRDQFL